MMMMMMGGDMEDKGHLGPCGLEFYVLSFFCHTFLMLMMHFDILIYGTAASFQLDDYRQLGFHGLVARNRSGRDMYGSSCSALFCVPLISWLHSLFCFNSYYLA